MTQARCRDRLEAGARLALPAALPTSAPSLRAQTPASKIAADLQRVIAACTEVQGESPNRLTARTAGALEYATGMVTAGVVDTTPLAGSRSKVGMSGTFIPSRTGVTSSNDRSLLGEP